MTFLKSILQVISKEVTSKLVSHKEGINNLASAAAVAINASRSLNREFASWFSALLRVTDSSLC